MISLSMEHLRLATVAAAQATLRRTRYYGPAHMRGFEAFGCVGDRYDAGTETPWHSPNPEVRPLGTVTFDKRGEITMRLDDDQEDWPDSELHNGVAHIEISASADDPNGCFLSVVGPDRDAVEAAWHRAADGFRAIREAMWQ
jgi:hypothetical protein